MVHQQSTLVQVQMWAADSASEIPTIDTITKDVRDLQEGQKDLVVLGMMG